jgi:carbamoyltransferase
LGAALAAWYIWKGHERKQYSNDDGMQGAYLGPEFSEKEILQAMKHCRAAYTHYVNYDELCKDVVELLVKGHVVGWFQGRMEFGPRALGNRSILGDPRLPDMQKKLNLKIKYREGFRPFAPSVLAEESHHYFELKSPSPYMLLVAPVKEERKNPLPPRYSSLPLYERLYYLRSDIPAITHVDYSARIQTVHKETNERYWRLIQMFKERTGYGLIVNTSFNVRGEPIVCTPDDAYRCFMRTEMDDLVMGDFLLEKEKQPVWKEEGNWKEKYGLD